VQEFGQAIVNGIGDASLYVMIGVGLALMFGVLGVVNFAQGDFMTVAAYVGLFVILHAGFGVTSSLAVMVPTGAAVGAIFFFVVLQPTQRGAPERRFLATFGVAQVLQGIVGLIWGVNTLTAPQSGSADHIGGVAVSTDLIRDLIVAVVSVALLGLFLSRTQLGREIRACAEDPVGAEMTGINIRKARCAAAVIASALTGVGGLMLLTTSYIYPQVGYSYILTGFAVVILGGLGSVGGVVVASLVIGIVTELVTSYISASDANLVPFVVILVVLLLRPSGIFARAAA